MTNIKMTDQGTGQEIARRECSSEEANVLANLIQLPPKL